MRGYFYLIRWDCVSVRPRTRSELHPIQKQPLAQVTFDLPGNSSVSERSRRIWKGGVTIEVTSNNAKAWAVWLIRGFLGKPAAPAITQKLEDKEEVSTSSHF